MMNYRKKLLFLVIVVCSAVIVSLLLSSCSGKPGTETEGNASEVSDSLSLPSGEAANGGTAQVDQHVTDVEKLPEDNDQTPFAMQTEAIARPMPSRPQDVPGILAPYYERIKDWASYHDLPENTTQLVVVDDTRGEIRARLFIVNENNAWVELPEFNTRAWGGSAGIRPKLLEGDMVTPVGQFPILDAFYIVDAPDTGLQMFRITEDTYWVDDPYSAFYNKRVEGLESNAWSSARHMISFPDEYKYGFVIGYNLECIPGFGSAVFFHVAQGNTDGGVGVSESACLEYLRILDKAKAPHILIVSDREMLGV